MELKNKIALSLAFLLVFFIGNTQENFKKGSDFYAQKNYKEAIKSYEKQVAEHPFDAIAYYDLGNSYFQEKEFALSLWAYEKALLIKPNFRDAEFNAQKAFEKTQQSGDWKNPNNLFSRILFSVGINFWAIISIFIALLLCTSLIFYFKSIQIYIRKILMVTNGLLVFLLLCSIFLAGLHYNRLNNQKEAIVIVQSAHAKVAPDITEKTAFDLPKGRKIHILRTQNDWIEVYLDDKHSGWLMSGEVKAI